MTINKTIDGDKATLELEGRLDTTTSPDLEESLKDVIGNVNNVTFDFSKLEYISSAGLRVLLSTHKALAATGKLTITNVNDTVKEVFDITGFADILNIV